ncbi:MAG: hypothetical protein NTX32_05150 [Candidatus Firestonebacteria bacterium]|nr:hypothetical protein [Candidatus Firestonebacteria bacterium]
MSKIISFVMIFVVFPCVQLSAHNCGSCDCEIVFGDETDVTGKVIFEENFDKWEEGKLVGFASKGQTVLETDKKTGNKALKVLASDNSSFSITKDIYFKINTTITFSYFVKTDGIFYVRIRDDTKKMPYIAEFKNRRGIGNPVQGKWTKVIMTLDKSFKLGKCTNSNNEKPDKNNKFRTLTFGIKGVEGGSKDSFFIIDDIKVYAQK